MNNGKRQAVISAAAIVILGLTAATWFRGDYTAVAGYDFATSLDPLDDLKRSIYLWDERLYTGAPNVLGIGTMPYFLLQYLFEKAAGSLFYGQMIFFTLILTLPGLTMYFFLKTIFEDEDGRGGISFFGALFYMFNTFVVVKWNRGELITLFSYGLLPLHLALIEKALKEGLRPKLIPALFLALFFFPVTLGHSADFLIIMGIIAAFFAWRLSLDKKRLRNAAILAAVAALSSLWWAAPLLSSVRNNAANISSFTTNELEMVHYYSGWASLLNLMKMWFFSMYTTALEFNTQFYRPGSLIFPILGFSALLFKRNGFVLFFSVMAVSGLWLAKGTAPPFSKIYEWMYLYLPYFFIFRAPSRYFPLIYTFSLTVLIGYTAGKISFLFGRSTESRAVHYIPGVAVMGLIFFHSWPLFSRDVIFRTVAGDTMYPSVFVNIPPYYNELNGWLKERVSGYRVHSFNNSAYLNYDWGYSSTDIATKILEVPQTVKFQQELVFGSSGFHGLIDSFDRNFWAWDFGRFDRVLGLTGVKYITVVDDALRRYLPDTNYPEIMESVLGSNLDITKRAQIGRAEVYENASALPLFFAENTGKKIIGDSSSYLTLSRTRYFERPLFININRPGDDAGLPPDSADGLLIVDENFTDLAARALEKEYRLRGFKNAEFDVNEAGDYLLYAKVNTGLKSFIDGKPVLKNEGERKDGIKWKYAGRVTLQKGAHIISSENEEAVSEALLAPVDRWAEAERKTALLLEKTKDGVSYVGRVPGGGLELYLKEGQYELRARDMKKPDRKRVFAFREVYDGRTVSKNWKIEGARLEEGRGIKLSLEGESAIAGKKILRGFDLEKFPYASVVSDSNPAGYFDASMILGIDTDRDGLADDELKFDVIKNGRNIEPKNIGSLLKERFGYPGKAQYDLVWAAIDLKKSPSARYNAAASFRLKELGFFYEVPDFKAPSKSEIRITADGRELRTLDKLTDNGSVSFGEARFSAGFHAISGGVKGSDGDSLLEVAEKRADEKKQGILPELQITKISPVKYLVEARAVDGQRLKPFWLVFNEAFNEGWSAYVRTEHERNEAVVIPFNGASEKEIKAHFEVNGFANGWRVLASGEDRIQMTIEFKPQRSLRTGALISGSFMIITLIVPAYRRLSAGKSSAGR